MRATVLSVWVALGSGLLAMMAQPAAPPEVFTAAQAAAGRAAYRNACEKCHTETLVGRDGSGEIPEFLKAYNGKIPPLAPPFLAQWGAKTTKDLSQRIQVAIGGFPPEGRDAETYLNLTAYVLEMNGARPGSQPLTASTAVVIESLARRR
jgi:hypothetical protein